MLKKAELSRETALLFVLPVTINLLGFGQKPAQLRFFKNYFDRRSNP